MDGTVNVQAVDNLSRLAEEIEAERERRRDERRKREQREHEREQQQQREREYFEFLSPEDLEALARGDLDEPTSTPPPHMSAPEVQERAAQELENRRRAARQREQEVAGWFRDLDRGSVETLSCGHRSTQELPCSDCSSTRQEWGQLFSAAPCGSKAEVEERAEQELERRRREQTMADGGGLRGHQVAGAADRGSVVIAAAVALAYLLWR